MKVFQSGRNPLILDENLNSNKYRIMMNNTSRKQRSLRRIITEKTGKKVFASEQEEDLAFDAVKPRSKGMHLILTTFPTPFFVHNRKGNCESLVL